MGDRKCVPIPSLEQFHSICECAVSQGGLGELWSPGDWSYF